MRILDGPALWSGQAHMPTILGRQIVVERAEGSWLYTTDGRRLFDGTAALWYANVGHGRPELARAAYEQMLRLETYHVFGRYANDKAIELSERLAAMSPIANPKLILHSGGSDAIDMACKLARRHWQREGRSGKRIIVSREFSYHGLHAYGTSLAGLEFNREGYGGDSLVPETIRVPLHDPGALKELINEVGADAIAAFVTEPIQGTGGVNPPSGEYLQEVQRICNQHDILFIVDEVITGFGRTGHMFATQRFGLDPDMITFAKGITSGYLPLGGVFVSPAIWEPFYIDAPETPMLRHGITYSGHAAACAVAMANLDILEREQLVPRVLELEALLRSELTALAARRPSVREVRVGGFMGGVSLIDAMPADRVTDDLIELGFVSRPLRGNTLQISPPFITTDDELRALIAAFDEALSARENA